jgi:L-ascorbate metabolism protein UlaG (beta-lactamase superfamily)
MRRRRKILLYVVLIIVLIGALGLFLFLRSAVFGELPTGARLERIKGSPNYQDGEFRNLEETPVMVSDRNIVFELWDFVFRSPERRVPEKPLPTTKTDFKGLDRDQDLIVWLGHSSYYVQLDGKSILVDPVLSDYAAPLSFLNEAFPGTTIFTPEDLPEVDYLFISHDHYDHLDYPTAKALGSKVKAVVTGLWVGAHLERWGFPAEKILEGDWGETFDLEGLDVRTLPARHFSGRFLTRNRTLWVSFAIFGKNNRIFLSGDSGHGGHFKEIGEEMGGFDLVALDCGQYNDKWPYVHMRPEEAVQAAGELGAKALIPSHVGRFSLSTHPWDEPFRRIRAASEGKDFRLLTPIIGEPVYLNGSPESGVAWWEGVD